MEIKTASEAKRVVNTLLKKGLAINIANTQNAEKLDNFEIDSLTYVSNAKKYKSAYNKLVKTYAEPLKAYFEKIFNKKKSATKTNQIEYAIFDMLNGYSKNRGFFYEENHFVYDWLDKEIEKEKSVKKQLRKASRSKTKLPTQSQLSRRCR